MYFELAPMNWLLPVLFCQIMYVNHVYFNYGTCCVVVCCDGSLMSLFRELVHKSPFEVMNN